MFWKNTFQMHSADVVDDAIDHVGDAARELDEVVDAVVRSR